MRSGDPGRQNARVSAERRSLLIRLIAACAVVIAGLTVDRVLIDLLPPLPINVYWGQPDAARRAEDTQALREVLPVLERLQAEQYINRDWCRTVTSSKGTWTDPPEADCDMAFWFGRVYVRDAQTDFRIIAVALDKTRVWVDGIDADYDAGGKLTHAEFNLIVGIPLDGYHIYVYEPGYTLPEATPGGSRYTHVDSDWYYYWMDWM